MAPASGTAGRYILSDGLQKAFASVGATDQPCSFKEVLSYMKDYIIENKHLLDPHDGLKVNCKGTLLGSVFGVSHFHYEGVKQLLRNNMRLITTLTVRPNNVGQYTCDTMGRSIGEPCTIANKEPLCEEIQLDRTSKEPSQVNLSFLPFTRQEPNLLQRNEVPVSPCGIEAPTHSKVNEKSYIFHLPEIPPYDSSAETEYSYQEYETECCADTADSEPDLEVETRESEIEYELVTDNEQLFESQSSDSDVNEPLLAILGRKLCLSDADSEFFADESDTSSSNSDSMSEEEENDKWLCYTCGIKNKPFMRYCLKCWQCRKDWYPDPPKKRKRKPRPKKNARRKGSSAVAKQGGIKNGVELTRESSTSAVSTSSTQSCSSLDSGISSLGIPSSQEIDEIASPGAVFSQDTFGLSSVKTVSYEELEEAPIVRSGDDKNSITSSEEFGKPLKDNVSVESPGKYSFESGKRPASDLLETEPLAKIPKLDSQIDDDLCIICCARPRNGIILHGSKAHAMCYMCAKRITGSKQKCPFCNVKIQQCAKIV